MVPYRVGPCWQTPASEKLFVDKNAPVYTEHLGAGAYGQVCKFTSELSCAAKLLYPTIIDPNRPNVCGLVQFEKEREMVHRDLSCNNVLSIGASVREKVTDFGISKLVTNPAFSEYTLCFKVHVNNLDLSMPHPKFYNMLVYSQVKKLGANIPITEPPQLIIFDYSGHLVYKAYRNTLDYLLEDQSSNQSSPIARNCTKITYQEQPTAVQLCQTRLKTTAESSYDHRMQQLQCQVNSNVSILVKCKSLWGDRECLRIYKTVVYAECTTERLYAAHTRCHTNSAHA